VLLAFGDAYDLVGAPANRQDGVVASKPDTVCGGNVAGSGVLVDIVDGLAVNGIGASILDDATDIAKQPFDADREFCNLPKAWAGAHITVAGALALDAFPPPLAGHAIAGAETTLAFLDDRPGVATVHAVGQSFPTATARTFARAATNRTCQPAGTAALSTSGPVPLLEGSFAFARRTKALVIASHPGQQLASPLASLAVNRPSLRYGSLGATRWAVDLLLGEAPTARTETLALLAYASLTFFHRLALAAAEPALETTVAFVAFLLALANATDKWALALFAYV
jgi:hypothetical protein